MLIASLCAFRSEDSFFEENRMAQFTFFRFAKFDFSYSFYLFCVNCDFLAVTDFAITAIPLAKV